MLARPNVTHSSASATSRPERPGQGPRLVAGSAIPAIGGNDAQTEAAVWSIDERRGYLIAKRGFDIAFAAALILLLAPLWLPAAILVKGTSRGPALYRHTRVGKGGRSFTCLKFRTMVEGAHDVRVEFVPLNEANGPVFKIRRDPRVTRVGRWLRKSSIDELPQLINVLRGEMSIVGPRPPLPEEVAHYTNYQLRRLAVTPGLTCLWQVSGRSHIGFDEWVELDLEYIRRRNFWLDLWLVVRTIPAVITGRGAF